MTITTIIRKEIIMVITHPALTNRCTRKTKDTVAVAETITITSHITIAGITTKTITAHQIVPEMIHTAKEAVSPLQRAITAADTLTALQRTLSSFLANTRMTTTKYHATLRTMIISSDKGAMTRGIIIMIHREGEVLEPKMSNSPMCLSLWAISSTHRRSNKCKAGTIDLAEMSTIKIVATIIIVKVVEGPTMAKAGTHTNTRTGLISRLGLRTIGTTTVRITTSTLRLTRSSVNSKRESRAADKRKELKDLRVEVPHLRASRKLFLLSSRAGRNRTAGVENE